MERDPLCGMLVDSSAAAGTRESAGRTWYLYSGDCLQKFDWAPQRYVQQATQTLTGELVPGSRRIIPTSLSGLGVAARHEHWSYCCFFGSACGVTPLVPSRMC